MPFHIQETLPFSHEQAVKLLYEAPWSKEERKFIVQGGLVALHEGFGREIRNCWHLWEPTSPLARHYQKVYGIGHADDMSSLIIEDLVARMRGEDFNIHARVRRYRDFWLSNKVDPVTQREIS